MFKQKIVVFVTIMCQTFCLSVQQLNVDIRREILKRALKFSRQQGGKKKKMEETE